MRLWQLGLGWLLLLFWGSTAVAVQPELTNPSPPLRLAQLDTAEFPQITLHLAAADPRQPLREDLHGLTLAENEIPIPSFLLAREAVGIDLIFVIDANESITSIDAESEATRLKKVQDALARFATQFMDPAGLDRVSVITPDEEGGRFLVQDAITPSGIINNLIDYAPERPGPTPLQGMLALALGHAQTLQDEHGRFQAIVVFTDGAELDRQLDFAALTAEAGVVGVPLYAAILGARADPNEIENVTRFTEPTRGAYLHMPQPEAADPLFALWQAHGIQARVQYRTPQPVNGRSTLTITQGSQQLTASYALDLAPPQLTLLLTSGALVRVGNTADTPLADLTPQQQEIPLLVEWPDGVPRDLATVSLLVNDQPQVTLVNPAPDSAGLLLLEWPLTAVDAGEVTLVAQAEDAFGLTAVSDPVMLTILVHRPTPLPPILAPQPTADPWPSVVETAVANPLWWAGGLFGLIMLLALLLALRRRKAAAAKSAADAAASLSPPEPLPDPQELMRAYLVLDGETAVADINASILLAGDNITIGRDTETVDVCLDDPSISRLHARIRRRADDTYWLYDEGSASGTFLDHQRLGLAPRLLEPGSVLRFGQVRATFKQLAMNNEPFATHDELHDERMNNE